ncbi:MAG: tRNA (adenosine(37)-N6)-threonylcarbamoyltransferase complex ATPase subunit type 1 TsaE [Candidatus Moranbacteria bacterium]|nr:tRNA (adenosine(37)-N6)-threonylcarbamoyltransferase complex ATPase subunit type 1 TsaE [Candidatus Moranbacteria bacterium]
MKKIITKSAKETQQLAFDYTKKIEKGQVVCFQGELGAGKTTFIQGILKSLNAKGPYTSPTFVIMKKYDVKHAIIDTVYHIDAYRIDHSALFDLGWEEIIQNKKALILLEWPEKIEKSLPKNARLIKFKWIDENSRELVFS